MAKWKSFAERMQEKYDIAPAVAPGISGSTKGSNTKSSSAKNSSSSLKGSKESASFLERMTEKYGDIQTSYQPNIDVQKQRDTVNSVMKPSKVYSDRYKEYLESVMNGYNTARKYGSSGALTAPLNNTLPGATAYQKSYYDAVNNNFLPGIKTNTAGTAKKNSSKDNTAKADKSRKSENNSSGNGLTAKVGKWAADNKELVSNAKEFAGILYADNVLDAAQKSHDALAKRYPDQVSKVDKYFDDLVEGTYKENEASRKANRELYASANPNWGKTATTAPLAKGGTFRKDIYEYLNDPDADKYIRDSFTKKGNEISSSARMFDSDEVERLGTMPEWIKQSEWYKNATEEDKKNRQQSKTGKFSLSKGFYSDRKFGATQSDIEVFNNMSEDEQKEYSYILGKYGEEKATAYLDTIKESVNERKANELYKQWLNEGADGLLGDATRYGKTLAGAVGSGLETFQRGATEKFLNAAAGSEDISTPRASEYLYQMQRANYDGAAGVGLDLAQNTAMMSPTLIAGAVASYFTGGAAAGEIASLATTMAPMAFGQAYEEAIADGADVRSAQKYAALEALNEAGGEYLLGGIENVAGGFTHQWAKNVLKNIAGVSDDMVSTTARALGHMLSTPEGRYLFSMGSEGFEEIVQGTVQNYLKNSVLGADESLNPFTEDNLYSAFIAMLSAGVSNAPSYVKANRYGKKVNVTAQDVRENAESISTKQSDYIDRATGDVDEQAYYDAMAEREHMLEQADYMEHGGQLTNAEAAELASANGGRIGMLNEAGRQSGLNAASDYEAVAERIANADADSDNKDVHEASNKAFDTAMAMAERAANNEQISNVEKGKAAIAARNIEAVSKMETTMRKAAEEREKAAARETDADKIADNKAGFEEYAAENAAGLYSEDSRSNMVSLYDGRVDADKYRAAYQRAYAAGFNNIDEKTAYNSMNMLYLNNEQKLQAYKDGMRDSNIYANRKLEYEQGEARVGGLIEGADKLDAKTGKFLDWVGKKTGVKIQIAEGLKGAAEINLDKGVMKINPYSENFVGAAAHELTHLIKLYDRKSFDKLQKLTVESLMKSNKMSYEDLYRKYENEYVEKISSDYTVEDILEEITAEGATAYLNDADFAERVAKEDSRLAKRIADFFREIADTLKAIINEKGIRAVGRVMRENEARYRTAANIWYQALENAGEKYKAGYTAKESDEGTKFMLNIDESDITEEYIDKNFNEVMSMKRVKTLDGKEFDDGKNVKEDIIDYFNDLGGTAENDDVGTIEIAKKFVKDAFAHKINRRKIIMMKAVPEIISQGKILNYSKDYDGEGNSRVIIGARFDIEKANEEERNFGGEYYGLVTIKVYPNHNRAYMVDYTYTKIEAMPPALRQTWMQSINLQEPGADDKASIRTIIERLLNVNGSRNESTENKLQLFDEPVEYTKNLIAVRNVSSGNLASMLELEGMPSPSIAITKDSLGHTQFGDVTFIFGRDTVDPEADSRNMVWDEVKLALVPDDIDVSLIDQMKAAGITDIRTYPAGDNAARAEMEGKADNLKFQLNIDDDPEWNYYANMIQDSNQETRDAADTLGELLSSVDYMPSNKAIERTAKRLKKYTATDTPLEDIIGNIKTVFSYIATNDNVNGKEISAILADYAGELITNSHKVEVDPTAQAEFRQFRNSIKGMTFHMPKGFEPELRSLGGIRQIRNESGLAIDITRDKGVSIDILYDELSDMYPGYFSKDITGPAEQLERIIETYKSLRPMPKVSYNTEEDYDAYRYYAGQEVFKAYIEEGINEAGHKAEYRALQRTYNKKLKENEKTEKEMAALQAKATEMQAKYLSELEASRKKIDKQTHRERMEAARKSTKTRYWKDQIMKDAKELSNWLLKPTDKKHVPEALREPLANFLAQLDFTSLDLNANGEPTQRSIYWMKLRDTWSKIAQNGGMAEGETGTQYMVVDTDILEKMSQLTDKIKDIKKLEELEYIDVLKLSDVMKAMKHSIETANQMIALNRSVESVATGTMEDLKGVKDHKNAGKAEGFQDMMTNRMLDADTRFHTFGKNAEEVYRAVRLGMNKKIQKTKMSADWFTELMQKVTPAKKDWTGKLSVESTVRSWSKDKLNIKLSDGTDMQLTVAQAMNLYNLLKRDQARDHILRGGITLTSIESDDNIIDKALKAKKNPVNVHVTQSDCLNIINALTAEQKQFADGLANTLQKAAQWGNETSMELMGYKKFNDKFYWPIKSSRDYIATSMDDAAAGGVVGVAVKNAGPTKNVVRHANNPILIGDVVDVWSEHINFMANYNAFTIPLTDMVKWYNYVDYGDFREEPGSNRYKNSVKQELRRAYGTGADQYIMRFIEQINGSGNRKDSSPVKALISAFKGSAVGFNLSVVIQQPTAIARAGAVIEGKYLTAGLAATDTANWETIKKYSAIAQWKDWGFFDTDTGKSMKSLLTGQDTLLETLNDKQMWMAGKADEITWNRMWAAAELKVRAEHKELAKGSDAYYKKAAEIFDEIIDKTQVVDSVFTKSDLMRSENELNKLMTSFFAEPTKSYNMMYRAWFDWHVAKDAAAKNQMAKQFARAAFCWTLSNVLAAMAKSIVTTMRDKDEDRDKAFWERWLEHTWDELKGNMAPWNYIPWVKDVASIFEGYSVTRPDTEFASDLYYVAQRWQKYIDGESKYTLGNNILYSAKLLSAMTGVAWYSAQRDANGLIDTAIEVMGADELNYQKQKLTGKTLTGNVAYYLGKAMTAYKNDHKALGDQIISDMLKAGVSEDKIEEKKKEMLKENEDMQTLIDDTLSGNDEDIEETRAALVAQGYSEDMIDSRLKSGINSYMEDNELTYAGVNEVLNGITDYTKAGFKEFDEAYKEWAEMAKLKNGWDDKKCREQFRSQCTKYFKPKYQEGNAAERSRILNILSRAKSTDGTKIYAKDEDITKWGA